MCTCKQLQEIDSQRQNQNEATQKQLHMVVTYCQTETRVIENGMNGMYEI